jgi:hypothetical protein
MTGKGGDRQPASVLARDFKQSGIDASVYLFASTIIG